MIMSLHSEVAKIRCEHTETHRLLTLKPNVLPQQETDDKLYDSIASLYGKLVQFRDEYAEKHRQVAVAVNMLADQSHIRDTITRAVKNIAVELPNVSSIVRAIQDTNHHKECRDSRPSTMRSGSLPLSRRTLPTFRRPCRTTAGKSGKC